ncbi:MAG: aminotransferase class III-fold pyridoxal phosphate-dependent enzyme [Planctomycetales bacterium]|nr:aminotransferase class III-fold pyridoxal phosphate-dependent enzyme [Planctomycetales bacterium]
MLQVSLEDLIQHPGEETSNAIRARAAAVEPRSLRTYTSSLAVIAKSAGAYHWTPEGRKLADFTSGVLVANLGHNPTRWWRRLLEYQGIDNITTDQPFLAAPPLTAYNALTELEVRASERLVECMRSQPGGGRMEQVLWAASGSEAVQKALWAAMQRKPDCHHILATRYGFHGKKGLAGAVTGSEQDPERDPRVRFIDFPMQQCIDLEARRQPLDLTPFRQQLEQLAAELPGKICCLITEPYLGGGGSFHPQVEYLQLLEQFCREHDIVFILDEIQANFGRTGPLFAFTHYGIEPDVVCLGKGLGNGVPVSAAVGSAAAIGTMKYGAGSDTWSANPLASSAVLATLDEFEEQDAIGMGLELSDLIERSLLRLLDTGLIEHVRGEGCVWGIACRAIGGLSADQVANACVRACYLGDDNGHAIHLLGPLAGKVIRISPPLTMDLGEAEAYFNAMHGIFASLRQRIEAEAK